jgi:putative transposase
MEFKRNRTIVYACTYHVVFCPKYRRKVLVHGIDGRLKAVVQEVAIETQSDVLEIEVMPDHVHLLIGVDPQFGIHRLVRLIKGRSSRVLREEFPWLKSRLPSLWTNSYFVSTTGGAPLSKIKQYIESQKRSER